MTGFNIPQALRASHIKPWKESTNRERLDPANGLLLQASLDALFDVGLVSFDGDGKLLLSKGLESKALRKLGLTNMSKLVKKPSAATAKYLQYHRTNKFAG